MAESVKEYGIAGYLSFTLQSNQHNICVFTELEGCFGTLQIASLSVRSNFILFEIEEMNKNFKITLLLNSCKMS